MVDMNVPNEDTTSFKFICRICSSILREPVRLKCGHRYCQLCITRINEAIIPCLHCNEKTLNTEIVIDQAFKHSMETANIICRLCNWTDIWRNYQDHLEQYHSDIICSDCSVIFDSIVDLDQHKKFSCQNRMIYCELSPNGCNEQFLRKNLFKHYLTEKHQCIPINKTKSNISRKTISTRIGQLNEQIGEILKQYRTIKDRIKYMNDLVLSRKSV